MRASVSRRWPRAHAICQRCGFRFNHDTLQWQFQWAGPKLQNLRLLVCRSCLDVPQEGLRTIILPPDPVPIQNPRPEQYVSDNNPNSGIGQSASPLLPGSNIGNMTQGGGTWAAFDGNPVKRFAESANLAVSIAGYNNWVGKNWGTGQAYTVQGFIMTAPRDTSFSTLVINYRFQGSSDGVAWTTLASGTTGGDIWETISVSLNATTAYQYHRLVFNGNGTDPVAIAQLAIDTGNRGSGAEGIL